jgi:phosphate-selective porin OprO/OprP
MRLTPVAAIAWLAIAAPTGPAQAASGLRASSDDGSYTVSLGGRVMWDTDTFDGALNRDHDGERRFDAQLRRARVELAATAHQTFHGILDVNINDDNGIGSAEVHAAGVRYSGWRIADVFIGRNKEPFGLEELTSSKAISSIERNYFTEATDVDSQAYFGVRLDGKAGPLGWSAGVFNPAGNPQSDDGGDRLAFTGRVFAAPIHQDGRVLHLGAAYTDRNLDQPISTSGFKLDIAEAGGELDSSTVMVDEDRQGGLEALYLEGPFSIQAEAFRRDLSGAPGEPDAQVDHQYLQVTWAVTGESRGYKRSEGIPGMIRPGGRRGAVELVAKLDRIRFDVDGRPDEEAQGVLVGANWYPNQHVKLMVNVIRVSSDGVVGAAEDDNATVLSTRVQFAF